MSEADKWAQVHTIVQGRKKTLKKEARTDVKALFASTGPEDFNHKVEERFVELVDEEYEFESTKLVA